MVRLNKQKIDDNFWEQTEFKTKQTYKVPFFVVVNFLINDLVYFSQQEIKQTYSTFDLFKFPSTRIVTIKVMYIWYVTFLLILFF